MIVFNLNADSISANCEQYIE